MTEHGKKIDLPKPVERVVSFSEPHYRMPIRLPYVDDSSIFFGKDRFLLSMHTDMMGSLCRTLFDLKPEIRKKLVIQGRAIDLDTWRELKQHPAFQFFYFRRDYRSDMNRRRETVKFLIPKSLHLTTTQLRDYAKLDFKPSSLSKELGFKVGWYPADFIMKKAEDETSYNSLGPFLAAVNQFEIGTDDLKPGILRMVGTRLIMDFESGYNLAKSGLEKISDRIIDASSTVLDMGDYM